MGNESEQYNTRQTLIRRVQDVHDERAWDEFVQVYKRYIYAVIRSMNISEQDADDLFQVVVIKLLDRLPKQDISQIKRFRSWLSTVTRNCVIDFVRKRTREAEQFKTAEKEDALSYLQRISVSDMDRIFEREWRIELTQIALENITPLFSERAIRVFRMSLKGASAVEIAEQVGLKENSIYGIKARVKDRLMLEVEAVRQAYE